MIYPPPTRTATTCNAQRRIRRCWLWFSLSLAILPPTTVDVSGELDDFEDWSFDLIRAIQKGRKKATNGGCFFNTREGVIKSLKAGKRWQLPKNCALHRYLSPKFSMGVAKISRKRRRVKLLSVVREVPSLKIGPPNSLKFRALISSAHQPRVFLSLHSYTSVLALSPNRGSLFPNYPRQQHVTDMKPSKLPAQPVPRLLNTCVVNSRRIPARAYLRIPFPAIALAPSNDA